MHRLKNALLIVLAMLTTPVLASETETSEMERASIDAAFKHLGENGQKIDSTTYQWLISVPVTEFNPHGTMPANNNTPTVISQPQTEAYHTTLKACEVTVSVKDNHITDATLSGAGCDEYRKSESHQRLQKALWPGFR
ncbi:MAG: hypothetical protein ACQES2_05725 [Pseudomonadota bacterium]